MMKYDALLQKLNHDADSLVAAISKLVDDRLLISISEEVYHGDRQEHFKALLKIRDEQIIPAPLNGYPKEVLELVHWSEPETIYEGETLTPETILDRHIKRAFSCAVLLRAMADPVNDGYFGHDNDSIAGLVDSLPALDPLIQAESLRFFAWRVQDLSETFSEHPFYLLALLLFVLRTQAPLTPLELEQIIQWIHDEVQVVWEDPYRHGEIDDVHQWLTWVTFFKQRHDLWQKIGLEIAHLADQPENSDVRQLLKDLAGHLEVV